MNLMFPHPDQEPVLVLDDERSWKLLTHTRHARVAFQGDDRLEIFPVNILTEQPVVYFRTAPGSKLTAAEVGLPVVLEADGMLPDQGWSVVARGLARELTDEEDIRRVRRLGLTPWVPTFKDHVVAVEVTEISGRHFAFGPHPER
ncbi:pyridoxamine 5'-phosphate oxidase family protein [Citricoccus muralis]|uniref:Pyridoxamine 5'-phosphate oxidase family protein n=1 Tax=Citricoccus muralis TaxID=169134 RepID=A0ABY8H9J2_9MICC|nr:pyridoxamine 5'-phosphate oxidase family protein [Citricoccus muralis]WFP17298.1 pyridoxamine 5'-phosphate oxidase family protein [Citricoccus muralis]